MMSNVMSDEHDNAVKLKSKVEHWAKSVVQKLKWLFLLKDVDLIRNDNNAFIETFFCLKW